MKTLEKVARAMAKDAYGCDWEVLDPTPGYESLSQQCFMELAEACLRAIREPDDIVVDAVQTEVDIWPEDTPRPSDCHVQFVSRDEAVGIWQAGIDAILEEVDNG